MRKNFLKYAKRGFIALPAVLLLAAVMIYANSAKVTAGTDLNSPWVNGFICDTPYDQYVYVENGIEFHYIGGDTFQGMMMIIPDSSRMFVGMPKAAYDAGPGASAATQAGRYGALLAVNGTFFVDTNFKGNGGQPLGTIISKGQCTYGANASTTLVGIDNNNMPVCGYMTGNQAIAMGVRDACTVSPVLVQNGQMTNLAGQSKTLIDGRTAFGYRADGATLILSIDSRSAWSIGATTQAEAEVFLAFGAVCAGNLDGGGSCGLYYKGATPIKLVNTRGGRPSPNSICIMP